LRQAGIQAIRQEGRQAGRRTGRQAHATLKAQFIYKGAGDRDSAAIGDDLKRDTKPHKEIYLQKEKKVSVPHKTQHTHLISTRQQSTTHLAKQNNLGTRERICD
jgi:hypothetical protein